MAETYFKVIVLEVLGIDFDGVTMRSSLLFTKLIQIMERYIMMDSSPSELVKNGIICQNWFTLSP